MRTAAVIGMGNRGVIHAASLLDAGGVRLVAVADDFGDAAERGAGRLAELRPDAPPPEVRRDWRAMLAEARPEVVCVALRPAERLGVIRAAFEAGARLVFCEKPIATTWAEAVAIGRVADDAAAGGGRLCVCHQRRYLAHFEEARRLLAGGAIGPIGVVGRMHAQAANLFDWGTHLLDAFLYLAPADAGRPVWVVAGNDRSEPRRVFDQPVERRGVYQFAFEGGLVATLRTDRDLKHDARLTAVGEGGILQMRGDTHEEALRLLRDGGPGRWERPALDAGRDSANATHHAVADALACLDNGGDCRIAHRHALAATELIFAGLLAAREGRRVDLPLPADADLSIEALTAAGPSRGP